MSKGLFAKESEVTVKDVVDTFTNFFVENAHHRIEGASIVPENDPTLLFINSGMAPMKDYFLGIRQPPSLRMTNVQGCIRTKDIEEVGDRHHLTFFEMLGSWSIGDYWKEGAITFAFELLTNGFGFPVDKLWASYYSGDAEKGIPADLESKEFWEKVGMLPNQIIPFGADNFWGPAGKFGPCGPCTEVYFDTGEAFGPDFVPGGDFDVSDRYIEIWNAGVFMQYDLQPSGFEPLAIKSVDTGSGLERMVMALNGMTSCYDIDNMQPIRKAALSVLGQNRPGLPEMITDHVRASVYIMSEGVAPSNTGRGYIPRRLIRRSLAALAQTTDSDDFTLKPVVDAVFEQVSEWNPMSSSAQAKVWKMFAEEQDAFKMVLRRGLQKLETAIPEGAQTPFLSGQDAFNLVATYGLPIDTIRDYLQSKGGSVDLDGFEKAFDEHREISRQGSDASSIIDYLTDYPVTGFVGLETTDGEGEVLVIMSGDEVVSEVTKGEVQIVCDNTVFYPQGGGQIGDVGVLTGLNGSLKVIDTKKTATGHIVHIGKMITGTISKGESLKMEVDKNVRQNNAIHHSATHLLNAALRETLGTHVGQKGSLVEPNRLRFDFTHNSSVSAEEQSKIQNIVNSYIGLADERVAEVIPYDDAITSGAVAMFSDKYGAEVRVVSFGEYSKELCGGTHVKNAKEIELLLLTAEGSSSRGVRRISAVAGDWAYQLLGERIEILSDVKTKLNGLTDTDGKFGKLVTRLTKILTPLDFKLIETALAKRDVSQFLSELSDAFVSVGKELGAKSDQIVSTLDAKIKKAAEKGKGASSEIDTDLLKANAKNLKDGTAYVVAAVKADVPTMRDKAMEIAEQIQGVVCFMTDEDRPKIVIGVEKSLAEKLGARDIMNVVGPLIGAKGGGKPHLVAGGGSNAAGIPELIEKFESLVSSLV